jgi:hypothetical protein
MRLAWFRATPPDSGALLDSTAPLIDALARTHHIDVVTAAEAHDFVWKHGGAPYDLCIYEAARENHFIDPYLLHYPGIALLSDATMADSRAWGGSRVVVASDVAVAQSLAWAWPAARMRHVQTGVADAQHPPTTSRVRSRASDLDAHTGELRIGVIADARRDVVERAATRARNAGAAAHVRGTPQDADVIVALEWPPAAGPPVAALHAMAAGQPVVVLEIEATAGWPAWDPQTWQPRGFSQEVPIAISIDPRDEEHSLVRAFVRLAADPALQTALGAAGRAWWRSHATVDHALASWEPLLQEAVTLGPAAPQPVADGSERAQAILRELGVVVDFLGRPG